MKGVRGGGDDGLLSKRATATAAEVEVEEELKERRLSLA